MVSASLVYADYEAKDFNYLIGNVPGLDDELLKMHFKLYQGYVNNSNTLLKKLKDLSESGQGKTPEYAGLKRMLGWEFDGMLLHEYYFDNLGKTEMLSKDSAFMKRIDQDFGSFDAWKTDFVNTGSIRGIGWVVTYMDPKQGRLINEWINEHDVGHLSGATPILIMDVFEHAYITQYGLDRAKYIETFFNNINWKKVAERYEKPVKVPAPAVGK
ncbi:MAG: superoxide dismutase [Parachlamydiaceae bacterium]|nr:superoxide dismutase [Parachlamydiaceae bacterium]